jgi:hypothetical protein
MRQVWAAVLGVLSVVATLCVGVVGADLLQAGAFSRGLFGDYVEVFTWGPPPAGSRAEGEPAQQLVQSGTVSSGVTLSGTGRDVPNTVGPPPRVHEVMEGEGALDLVLPPWMVRRREHVEVRFPGGRTHTLPYFTRVPPGLYMLEFYGTSYKSVLCQVQVNLRSRSRVTFGGQNCRVELND